MEADPGAGGADAAAGGAAEVHSAELGRVGRPEPGRQGAPVLKRLVQLLDDQRLLFLRGAPAGCLVTDTLDSGSVREQWRP